MRWIDTITTLPRFRRKDGRLAPHKPIVLLLGIGRHLGAGTSQLVWRRDAALLEELLSEYGNWGRSHMGDPHTTRRLGSLDGMRWRREWSGGH